MIYKTLQVKQSKFKINFISIYFRSFKKNSKFFLTNPASEKTNPIDENSI